MVRISEEIIKNRQLLTEKLLQSSINQEEIGQLRNILQIEESASLEQHDKSALISIRCLSKILERENTINSKQQVIGSTQSSKIGIKKGKVGVSAPNFGFHYFTAMLLIASLVALSIMIFISTEDLGILDTLVKLLLLIIIGLTGSLLATTKFETRRINKN